MFDQTYHNIKKRDHFLKSFSGTGTDTANISGADAAGDVGVVGGGMAKACKGMLIKGKFRKFKKGNVEGADGVAVGVNVNPTNAKGEITKSDKVQGVLGYLASPQDQTDK